HEAPCRRNGSREARMPPAMLTHFLPPGALPDTPPQPTHEADALIAQATSVPPRVPGTKLFARVDASAPEGDVACRAADERPAHFGSHPLACPNHPPEQEALDARVRAAARLDVDGVLL